MHVVNGTRLRAKKKLKVNLIEVSFLYKTDLCVFTRKVVSGGCNCQVQDHPIKIWPTFQQAFTHANILKYPDHEVQVTTYRIQDHPIKNSNVLKYFNQTEL